MHSDLKGRIEDALRETRYHPDFAKEADHQIKEFIDESKQSGRLESVIEEVRSRTYDSVLMQEKYFPARLEFLTRLISYLGERPEPNLAVAEDGCGTGVDLHVLNVLLADKVTLTGIDKSEASLAIAKRRVPNVRLIPDFDESTFDVIYSDYVSIDGNFIWEIGDRGSKAFYALRSPGIVLQNADMRQLSLYCSFFGQKFSKTIRPELLASIEGGHDAYLCRFEKD